MNSNLAEGLGTTATVIRLAKGLHRITFSGSPWLFQLGTFATRQRTSTGFSVVRQGISSTVEGKINHANYLFLFCSNMPILFSFLLQVDTDQRRKRMVTKGAVRNIHFPVRDNYWKLSDQKENRCWKGGCHCDNSSGRSSAGNVLLECKCNSEHKSYLKFTKCC